MLSSLILRFFILLSTYQTWDQIVSQYGGPNRDFVYSAPRNPSSASGIFWQRPLGQGTSGIVSDGTAIYTMYAKHQPSDKNSGEEYIVAMDSQTGKTLWEHHYPMSRLKGQETFLVTR